MEPEVKIQRRKTRQIFVGNVPVGGDAPISVQSMTNTETCDVDATVGQIRRLQDAGVDIVRVSVPSMDAAEAFGKIRQQVDVPLVADIHYDYKIALAVAERGVDCLRINPGNIGREDRIKAVIQCAKDKGLPIRIGVNAGSIAPENKERFGSDHIGAIAQCAIDHCEFLDDADFYDYVVSIKDSDPRVVIEANQRFAEARPDVPLHLGVTEAGMPPDGTIKTRIAFEQLLSRGIGDTIRVSLSAEPEQEVRVGYEILKSLGLRTRGVRVVSCPSCSRQGFDVIRTVEALEKRLEHIKTPMSLSVLGCVVNGPGEARETDIGITGGGKGKHMVYLSGVTDHHVEDESMLDHIVRLVEEKAARIEAGEDVAFDPHAAPAVEAAE